MNTRILCATLALAIALPGASVAQSRNCGDRDTIVNRLSERYGESRSGGGLTHTNGMLEIYTSEETGTWTILITLPSGQSCLVAAGEFWEDGGPNLTKSGAPV